MVAFILLVFVVFFHPTLIPAQTTPPSLTVLYTNNINGEIDPCPV